MWTANGHLQWRHDKHDGVPNHQPHDCLLNHLFGHRWKKTSKLRVTGLCEGNSPVTGEFPTQRASYAENVSIWWRHHGEPVHNASWSLRSWTQKSMKHMLYQLQVIFLLCVLDKWGIYIVFLQLVQSIAIYFSIKGGITSDQTFCHVDRDHVDEVCIVVYHVSIYA